jgi:immune inhibitor A
MENQTPDRKSNTWVYIVAGVGGLFVLACVCIVAAMFVGGLTFGLAGLIPSASTPVPVPPSVVTVEVERLPTQTPDDASVTAPPTAEPGDDGSGVEAAASELPPAELPPRDRYDLARRFLGIEDADPPEPVEYAVGDVASFWVSNDDTDETLQVEAELAYIGEYVYMWVEQGMPYDEQALEESADRFSEQTYPTNHSYFGSEASPGIDGDVRLHVLHSVELGSSVAGYFYSPSEYPASVVPYSNEKEIFFINISNTPPGSFYYDSVLAHEFQHMIHWHVDQNEESWMNEGMSEMAAYLNGFGPSDFTSYFLMNPDLQLNDWPDGGGTGANYGAGFLFTAYFLERFGQDALRHLVANPLNGLPGVDDTLAALGQGVSADELFSDWVIANLLNASDGVYGYPNIPDLLPASVQTSIELPRTINDTVHQYGADYIQLDASGEVTVRFDGEETVRILPTNTVDTDDDPATDDRNVWWSNRGDDSDMTLTRPLDLTGVDEAMLTYDLWYEIEEQWDYAYLTVSTDGGDTWEILPTPYTTTEDPHGNSYGPGYTGFSEDQPDADPEGWLHETIDLSGYAGQEILLRFEMITDDAVNQPGLAVDNLCVDAIGWCDDAEADDAGWDARGFVRHDNVLRQNYVVQAIVPGADGTTVDVKRMALDGMNEGTLTFTVSESSPAVLAISGLTRNTTQPAAYTLTVE